ncbi:MAG: hypothetical protein U1E32_10315 [Rhodoglobus sp.]|nr:hypothetical protein [Rhodoglobus sp.]
MNSGLAARTARLRELIESGATHEHWGELYRQIVEPYEQAAAAIKAGDKDGVDLVLEYLELHPRFFRSGYVAERLIRALARAQLTVEQRARARKALQNIAEGRTRERREAVRVLDGWDSASAE